MDVAAPLPLLEALASQLPPAWAATALARRREALEQLVAQERGGQGWDACQALRVAHLWLVAGLPGRGDDLVLEAAELAPAAGLIPDWWGLWPLAEPPTREHEPARQLAMSYLELRHLPPLQAWQNWQSAVASEAGRLRLDEPALQLLLGLVLHGREQLQEPLEPVLVQVAGEALVAAEPALAWRFYDPLSERLPGWDYALLKAADLSLQRGDLERCRAHLSRGMELHGQNPWLHDIAARLAVAEGAVEQALEAWQRATACCADQPEEPRAQMLELFRQRAREARRGPGVLQARSLIHRGETAAAVALLQTLLEQDPQWQPLRSLLEQAQAPAAGGTEPMDNTGGSNLDRLEQRLRLLAERANLAWPVAAAAEGTSTDAEGWERHLQQALGRLALLG